MKDSFYTPSILADRLIRDVNSDKISTIADFCVGHGELLRSAMRKWPNARFFGTDISKSAVKYVKSRYPNWTVSRCDFLSPNSRSRTDVFKRTDRQFDLILLNPPFSCIGGATFLVEFRGQTHRCSTSMHFLIEALKHLGSSGTLLGILPLSIAYSQKDQNLWRLLQSVYDVSIIEEPQVNHFKDCSPNVIMVSITNQSKLNFQEIGSIGVSKNIEQIIIYRGKIGMHTLEKSSETMYFEFQG